MQPLPITDRSHLLVLTGAGVSAESGIPTFRDAGGLWEGRDVREVATWDGFAADPLRVWRFYSERRQAMADVAPNAAHRALAALEARLGDRFLLATQNIDGLHQAAGSQRVVELHGNLMRSRCSACDRAPFDDRQAYRAGVAPAGTLDLRSALVQLALDLVERAAPDREIAVGLGQIGGVGRHHGAAEDRKGQKGLSPLHAHRRIVCGQSNPLPR